MAEIRDDERYSLEEAARLIHPDVNPGTLRNAAYRHKLAVLRIGGVTLVTGAALKAYIEASTKPCHAQAPAPDSSSTDQTSDTAPRQRRASRITSGTSSGTRAARSASDPQARALRT